MKELAMLGMQKQTEMNIEKGLTISNELDEPESLLSK